MNTSFEVGVHGCGSAISRGEQNLSEAISSKDAVGCGRLPASQSAA